MLFSLFKKDLGALGSSISNSSLSNNKKPSRLRSTGMKLLVAILLIYVVGIFGFMFYMLSDAICVPFVSAGIGWVYFAILGTIGLAFNVIGSSMTTYSTVYEAKDNELLLSMPIKPSNILFTRVLTCFVISWVTTTLPLVPACIVYAINFETSALLIIGWVVVDIFLSILGLIISLLIGWVIAQITSRIGSGKKGIVSLILVVVFLGAYFYIYSNAMDIISQMLLIGDEIGEFLKTWIYPIYLMGEASLGSLSSLGIFAGSILVVFALVYAFLSKTFIKLATRNKGAKKVKYKEQELKASSVTGSLLAREWLRFRTCSAYLINCGLGAIFLIAAAVAMLIFKEDINGFIEIMAGESISRDTVAGLFIIFILYLSLMSPITSCSISLDARTLWIFETLPINPMNIIDAKIYLHLLIIGPASLLCTAAAIYVVCPSLASAVIMIAMVILFNLFYAAWGLARNVKKPSLNWTNETQAVKQGTSTLVVMLGSMGLIALLVIAYVILINFVSDDVALRITYIAGVVIFFGLFEIKYTWLKKKGTKILMHI